MPTSKESSQRTGLRRRAVASLTIALTLAPLLLLLPTIPCSARDRLSTTAEEALAAAERVRGVTLTSPVKRRVSDENAVRAYLVARIRADLPPEVVRLEEIRLRRLGLLPADGDLLAILTAAMTRNISGFYAPETRTLHVARAVTSDVLRPVLIHEWTHALQDEKLDLARLLRRVQGHADYQAATMALLEGDATAVMLAASAKGVSSLPELAAQRAALVARLDRQLVAGSTRLGMPRALAEDLGFLYAGGLGAVLYAWHLGGWAALDRWVREHPPLSTEQVLHPERALGKTVDCPRVLTLAGLPDGAFGGDTMGEAGFRTFLRVHLSREQADSAAAGWDGDRYAALPPTRPGGQAGLVVASVWDAPKEARELTDALREARAKSPRLGNLAWEHRGDRVVFWLGDGPPPRSLLASILSRLQTTEVCDAHLFEAARRVP